SYAIENLNKTIRTSHTIDGGGSEIFVIDNNTSRSYCYAFNGNKLEIKVGTDSDSDCSDIGASFAEIVGDNSIDVSGSFSVKETDRSVGERGFVRTNIELRYVADALDNFEDDVVVIQSSVSLRDYGYNVP
ncbi:MAG: hypothetical protein KAQ63_00425, partial [Candidatus Moranbacteria bacterium]|nr:hypothetical protein [Candidatus Moranbacteria bacterium]